MGAYKKLRAEHEPHDFLTSVADHLLSEVQNAEPPDQQIQAIVLLTDAATLDGGIGARGYDGIEELISGMAMHMRGLCEAHDLNFVGLLQGMLMFARAQQEGESEK